MAKLQMVLLFAVLALAGCDHPADVPAAAVTSEKPPQPPPPPQAPPVPGSQAELGVQEEPSAAEPAPNDACASAESCHAAAAKEEHARHPERAVPLYTRACELGNGQACHRLGELYRDGKGVAADDGQARALFERGCVQGSTAACDELGH